MDRCVDIKVWDARERVSPINDEAHFLFLAECVQERKDIGTNSFHQRYEE
jgi:hypothetical protein